MKTLLVAILVLGSMVTVRSQTPDSPGAIQADIVYVRCGDGENFGIHETPSTAGTVIAKANCGDALISFGQENGLTKVRTDHGVVGYIATVFVSPTKPLAATTTTTQPMASIPRTSPDSWARNQKLTVIAVSHSVDESDYTTKVPETSNTNCNIYTSTVNCNTTQYGGGTRTNAVYRFKEIVTHDDGGQIIQYTLARTARWRWSTMDHLEPGSAFEAEIKDKHMYVTAHRGGNQGKKETMKYDILDIRPVP